MADAEKLTISDAENAYKGILELVKKYPDFPSTFKASNSNILWNTTSNTPCIALFPLQGAIYLKKYIDGSYVGLLPFEVVYKTSPTTNKANIDAQAMITDLCSWLEDCGIDFSDTKMTLESIERTTPAFVITQDANGTELAINMQLKYTYKK